jgi:DNA-binding transcriptional ArsR family regulator
MRPDEIFTALADGTRREIVGSLADRGPCTATQLAAGMPITRQAVAKHLAVLERAGLVSGARRGREMVYVVQPERLDAATAAMGRVAARWDRRLDRIKRIAEERARR